MENNQWKVQVNSIDLQWQSQVYIYRFCDYGGVRHVEWLEINSPDIVIKKLQYLEGNDGGIKPTFICRPEEAMNIAKGFIAYADSQGFKSGDETFTKGKLEATEKHLEDMRSLVFQPTTIITGTHEPMIKKH